MAGPGRPSLYSPELTAIICERVLMRSLRQVCQDEDMPPEGTVYGWLDKYPAFFDEYARARSVRAFRRETDMDEITDAVRIGTITPEQGRVLIDAIKWQSGRENAPVFGAKVEMKHKGRLTLEQLVAGTAAETADTPEE
jgi:hypothetical protein